MHEIPIAHDLDWHKSNKHCWEHFDIGLLDLWNQKKEPFCTPASPTGTSLQCRETVDRHLPAATAPHTMCDATNLGIRFNRLKPAKCQKHRPGYNCKVGFTMPGRHRCRPAPSLRRPRLSQGEPYFWSYHKGALVGACTRVQRAFQITRFPRDHLRDIFDSWTGGVPAEQLPKVRWCTCTPGASQLTLTLPSPLPPRPLPTPRNRRYTPHPSRCLSPVSGGSTPICSTP